MTAVCAIASLIVGKVSWEWGRGGSLIRFVPCKRPFVPISMELAPYFSLFVPNPLPYFRNPLQLRRDILIFLYEGDAHAECFSEASE